MDFLKILKSFEEFVYEALIWIVLLPKTLIGIVLFPRRMTRYAAAEMAQDDEVRFSEGITPPLLLILCVVLAHVVDLVIRPQTGVQTGSLAGVVLASEENLLLYRTIAFGVWALAGAICLLAHTGEAVGRNTLRRPFYEQCYLVAPFALVSSIGISLSARGNAAEVAGALMLVGSMVWFWCVQVAWIRAWTQVPWWRAALTATLVVGGGAAANAALGHLLSASPGG